MKSAGIIVVLVTIAGLFALFFKMSFVNFLNLIAVITISFTALCLIAMLLNWLLDQKKTTKATNRQIAASRLRKYPKR